MIEQMRITNLGLIRGATIDFAPGLTAITGETGAGKTMLMNCVQMLFGGRGGAHLVAQGADKTVVEGTIAINDVVGVQQIIAEVGAETDDGFLELSRILTLTGRSKGQAGGRGVPMNVLAQIGKESLTIHGQSEQLLLRTASWQRAALDDYAGSKHGEILQQYTQAYTGWQETLKMHNDRTKNQAQRRQRVAYLEEVSTWFEEVNPLPDEETHIINELALLENSAQLRSELSGAHHLLAEDNTGVGSVLYQVNKLIEFGAGKDPALKNLKERITGWGYEIAEATGELATYIDGLDVDPNRIDYLHNRRAILSNLANRCGIQPEALDRHRQTIDKELGQLLQEKNQESSLANQVETAKEQVEKAAMALHKSRLEYADKLGAAVNLELADLALAKARFEVEVRSGEQYASDGSDTVEFRFSPHPKSLALALGQGASGGELSRVMLALEVVISEKRSQNQAGKHTYIFDEIDAGIGGEAGLAVGLRLQRLAKRHQVIVVTHLAQVAAHAEKQIVVKKVPDSGESDFITVSGVQRSQELARMLSGQSKSKTALRHADELLDLAFMKESEA